MNVEGCGTGSKLTLLKSYSVVKQSKGKNFIICAGHIEKNNSFHIYFQFVDLKQANQRILYKMSDHFK